MSPPMGWGRRRTPSRQPGKPRHQAKADFIKENNFEALPEPETT